MFKDKFGYNEKIPADIREIFMWLCQDVVSLFRMWDFYNGLFGNTEVSIMLSDYTKSSFVIIEEALRISMIMAICRLNDPSIQQNHKNLSLIRLVDYCKEVPDIHDLYTEYKQACTPFDVYRNKRFGHRDLETALDYEGNILPGINKKNVDNVLELASKLLNSVALHYSDSEFYFKAHPVGGAESLLFWMKKGIDCYRNPED
jgi:hypothetical protein